MTPLWEDFMRLGPIATLLVRFPAGDVDMSPALLAALRLTPDARPRSLEQWCELCHPEDHGQARELNAALLRGAETALSLARRLYCGDGVYRAFRLDACIRRGGDGAPLLLMGVETALGGTSPGEPSEDSWERRMQEAARRIAEGQRRFEELLDEARVEEASRQDLALSALVGAMPFPVSVRSTRDGRVLNSPSFARLADASPHLRATAAALSDGERLEVRDRHGRTRTLEARTAPLEARSDWSAVALYDVTEVGALEEENLRLRGRLQRIGLRAAAGVSKPPAPSPIRLTGPDATPEAEGLRTALSDRLSSAVRAISESALHPAFLAVTAHLQGLFQSLRETELTVGAVGLTGSGKSTFINAMMGERLLPEETRATTNAIVLCRRGGVRAADVFYLDGRIERTTGPDLTPDWMEERTSERWNPGNERGIDHIEWNSPDAAIPSGLVLADTPGLDACDLPRYGELTLRRLLPSLDIALYLAPLRARFKSADVELMHSLLTGGRQVVLLLSQIDLERDEVEAGSILLSRRQRLERAVAELREDLQEAGATSCPIIPISSRLALDGFFRRTSPEWEGSNFDPLIRQLTQLRRHLIRCGTVLRGRRALCLLERTEARLAQGMAGRPGGERQDARCRELRDAQRWLNAELSTVRNEWSRSMSRELDVARFASDVRDAASVGALRDACLRWESRWSDVIRRMTERMDWAREACRKALLRHGVFSEALSGSPSPTALPGLDRHLRRQETELRSQVHVERIIAAARGEDRPLEKARAVLIRDGVPALARRLDLLRDHLNWWENHMREACCDPVYLELEQEEKAAAEANALAGEAPASRAEMTALRLRLTEEGSGIRELLAAIPPVPELSDLPLPVEDEPVRDARGVGILASLLQAMGEQRLQAKFFALPALTGGRQLVLLGLRRQDGLRLASRLMHDARLMEARTQELDLEGRSWLLLGEGAPPFPCLHVPDAPLPGGLRLLSAPADALAAPPDGLSWEELLAGWTPIVHLDLARVDSGLSDLARAPYAAALASAPRWVLAFAHGGIFDRKLADLVADVPERVAAFRERRGFRGRMDWFVYENYDARYTDFIEFGQQVSIASDAADFDALAALWRESGIGFEPPFDEPGLRAALAEGRDKLRHDVDRPLPRTVRGGSRATVGTGQEGLFNADNAGS